MDRFKEPGMMADRPESHQRIAAEELRASKNFTAKLERILKSLEDAIRVYESEKMSLPLPPMN